MWTANFGFLFGVILYCNFHEGEAQIAALFTNVSRSPDCSYWSNWGECVWTRPTGRNRNKRDINNLYLDQLSAYCKGHWFYRFVTDYYAEPLNNIFSYLKSVTLDPTPCGMCAYRQSCGYGGFKQCNVSPLTVKRNIEPIYVAEEICPPSSMEGRSQQRSCYADPRLLRVNGAECKIWPAPQVPMTGLSESQKQMLYNIPWANCLPDSTRTYCRCCCYPYRPNPVTYQCEHIPGTPLPPGM